MDPAANATAARTTVTAAIVTASVGDTSKSNVRSVIVGVLCAPVAFTLIDSRVYGIPPWNPIVLAIVSLFLGSVSIAAAAVPALRAAGRGEQCRLQD